MPSSPLNAVLHQLRAAGERDGAGNTDGELLTRFLSHRDDNALAALVERHAPMVWGVCRRVLRNPHDAEDAFQATFLVLVRKAATVVPREVVANWLYGVAHQTAVRLRSTAAKRGVREMQLKELPEPAVAEARASDLLPLLDQELSRLPEHHRVLIVLCDLEGKTRKEAARQLGCPEGTVASRLARARDLLAKRMARHGLAVSGGSLAAALAQSWASAGVPDSVVSSTIHVATLLAANQAVGVISGPVAALTEGVLKAMLLKKIMATTMVVLVLSVAAITGGSLAIGQTEGTGKPVAAKDVKQPAAEKPVEPEVGRAAKPLAGEKPMEPAEKQTDPELASARLLTAAAYSPDGKWLAFSHQDTKTVTLYDTSTWKKSRTLEGLGDISHQVVFSADSSKVFAACNDGLIYSWETKSGKLGQNLNAKAGMCYGLTLSPDGKLLASGHHNQEQVKSAICLWDPATGKQTRTIASDEFVSPHTIAFTPNGKAIAGGYHASHKKDPDVLGFHGVIEWDVNTGKEIKRYETPRITNGATPIAHALAYTTDGKWLIVGGGESVPDAPGKSTLYGYLWLFNRQTAKLERTLQRERNDYVRLLAFSPDGSKLYVPVNSILKRDPQDRIQDVPLYEFQRWDTTTWKADWTHVSETPFSLSAIAVAPNAKWVGLATSSGFKLLDTKNGTPLVGKMPTDVAAEKIEKPSANPTLSPKTEAPSVKEAFTAWGKEVGDLQAGLGFKAGEMRSYSQGETANLVVRVRNVGKSDVVLTYSMESFEKNPPTVVKHDGKQITINGRNVWLRMVKVSIAPGKEIELGGLGLQLRPSSGKDNNAPWTLYEMGKFQVQYEKIGDYVGLGNLLNDSTPNKLSTGKLDLEVKQPEKVPQEKYPLAVPPKADAAPAKPKPNYVTVVGQLLDDETGKPIEKAGWEWGMADPKKPEQIAWGHSRSMGGSYPGGRFEMLVNIGADGNHYPLRVYSAGYETTIVVDELAKPYPEKIERIVRLKRGRNITGVLRDHTGKPVANGWVFFIPKGHRTNIVEGIPGTDAHQLPDKGRDGAVAEVRTNSNGTFALSTGSGGTLAASTDLVDLWPFPLPEDGYADLKMPAPSYLVIDLTYWYLDELAKKGKRELSPNSEDPNQCWLQVDQSGSTEPLWKNLGYRRQMLVFAKDPRAKLSKGVIVGHVVEGGMEKPIPDVGHNKNLATKIRVALPPGSYRVQRLRAGPFAPVDEKNVVLKPGEDTNISWARGDGSSVRGKATWPANLMFVRQPGEAPRKLDWTVPDTATVWIAPVGADGKQGQPIETAKIQPDGSFFIATNLVPGKYKATASVYLPERDFRGGLLLPDCEYSQEFIVPDPARGPFGSPPVDVELKMAVGAGGRFVATDPPAAPAKPANMVEPPAEKEKEPFMAGGKEVGGLEVVPDGGAVLLGGLKSIPVPKPGRPSCV